MSSYHLVYWFRSSTPRLRFTHLIILLSISQSLGCVTRYRAEAIESNILVMKDRIKLLETRLEDYQNKVDGSFNGIQEMYDQDLVKRLKRLDRVLLRDRTYVQELEDRCRKLEDEVAQLKFKLKDKSSSVKSQPQTIDIPEGQEQLYEKAEEKIKEGAYQEALNLYTAFIKRYPDDSRIDNALYQVALSHYHMKQFNPCISVITQIVQEYPKGDRAERALLLLYDTQRALKQCDRAREALNFLKRTYPKSKLLPTAKRKLEQRCD